MKHSLVLIALGVTCVRLVAANPLALDAVRFSNTSPPAAARHLAMVHAAMFDAVNSRRGKYVNHRPHTNAPTDESEFTFRG